jgi:hypothetical protein
VPAADPRATGETIAAVAKDETAPQMVERAQWRMTEARLTSRGLAQRFAKLSREPLGLARAGDKAP